jgi:predicted Zn-dependent peptidase
VKKALIKNCHFIKPPKCFQISPYLQLIVEEQPWALSTSVGLYVGYGSRYESPKNLGITHLTEHLFFKGSTRSSAEEMSYRVERFGGEMNAYTDRELTCFYIYAPRDHEEESLEILFETIFDARFDSDDFEKEKNVVAQELLASQDSSEECFWDRFFEIPWGQNSLGKRVGGFADKVSQYSYRQLTNELEEGFFRAPFTLVVCGAVDAKKILKLTRDLKKKASHYIWGKIALDKPRKRTSLKSPVLTAPYVKRSVSEHHKSASQIQLGFAYPGVSLSAKNEILYSALASLAGLGSSSLLYNELREKRALVYNTHFQSMSFSDAGMMIGYFSVDPSGLREAVKVCGESLRNYSKMLSKKDEDFINSSMSGAMLLNFEGSYSRMEALGRQMTLMGRIFSFQDSIDDLESLKLSGLKRIAEIFKRTPCFYMLGPQKRPGLGALIDYWNAK